MFIIKKSLYICVSLKTQIYIKMSTIAEKIKEQRQTPYQEIAEKFNTNVNYIGAIARGERIPTRGKGLKIKNYLNELISDK